MWGACTQQCGSMRSSPRNPRRPNSSCSTCRDHRRTEWATKTVSLNENSFEWWDFWKWFWPKGSRRFKYCFHPSLWTSLRYGVPGGADRRSEQGSPRTWRRTRSHHHLLLRDLYLSASTETLTSSASPLIRSPPTPLGLTQTAGFSGDVDSCWPSCNL